MRLAPILLLLAGCASSRAPKPDIVELTVLTWNILHGANDAGELNLEAKGRYIAEQRADLVLLQEIDGYPRRSFLGGTSVLIVVSVALDLVDKLNSHLLMRNYDGFMKGGGGSMRRK